MRIKSFIASTVQEALADVKREMGDTSIILETRDIEEGDIKSMSGQKLVEVVAAENIFGQNEDRDMEHNDDHDVQDDVGNLNPQTPDLPQPDTSSLDLHQLKLYPNGNGSGRQPVNGNGNGNLAGHLRAEDMFEMAGYSSDEGYIRIDKQDELDDEHRNPLTMKDEIIRRLAVRTDEQNDVTEDYQSGLTEKDETISRLTARIDEQNEAVDEYRKELSAKDEIIRQHEALIEKQNAASDEHRKYLSRRDEVIRHLTVRLNKRDAAFDDDWPETSKELYKQLCAQQVEEKHSGILINEIVHSLGNDDREEIDLQRLMIKESIVSRIKIPVSNSNNQDQCKAMAFIGTAGTGKSSTIAKIAMEIKRYSDKDIILISIRGNSAGKLKKIAGLMGATVMTVTTPGELREIRDEFADTSHILIETPGISSLDNSSLYSLKAYLNEMPDIESHLVINATTRYVDIMNIIKKVAVLPVHRLLFARVDETDLHGTLFSVAMETGIPISFITDGQEIPEDIRPVTAEMVAEMILKV